MTARGITQLRDPRVTGAVVGAVGGSAFVLVNQRELPDRWASLAVAAWVVSLMAWAWFVMIRPRTLPPLPAPAPRAGAIYGASVAAMVVLIVVSARVLAAVDRPDLVPAAVAVVVGLHFVPFARAFHTPVFGTIGWTMAAVGAAGLLTGFAGADAAGAAAGVVAGLVMIGLVAADASPRA